MKAYIVTGTTRGIGRAIGETVLASKDWLLSLSREPEKAAPLHHNVHCDLGDHRHIATKLSRLLRTVSHETVTDLVLINNAGILEPLGPIDEAAENEMAGHLMINLAAPAVLMSAFIRLTQNSHAKRRIINISSGAARHPYAGWAMYCASKAALDMMTLCVAAEQSDRDNPVAVCAVYPGKVETDMQRSIRQCDPGKFPAQPDFIRAKELGALFTAEEAARKLLALDIAGELRNGGLYDLRRITYDGIKYTIRPMNDPASLG